MVKRCFQEVTATRFAPGGKLSAVGSVSGSAEAVLPGELDAVLPEVAWPPQATNAEKATDAKRRLIVLYFEGKPGNPRKVSRMDAEAFWPRYLSAHSDPRTRAIHTAGTIAASTLLLAGALRRDPWLAVAGVVAGYAPAWLSHALIERNRPETFRAPFRSLAADYRMAFHVLCGTIDAQYEQHGLIAHR